MLNILNLKFALPIIIGLSLIIGWKYWDLTSTIKEQKEEIKTLEQLTVVLRTDLNTERGNVELLKNTVEELNVSIEKISVRNRKIQKEYDRFKNQSVEEKYTQQILNLLNSGSASCQDGIELNKSISGLKYEDL